MDVVSDRAVGSVFVLVSAPSLQLFAGVGKAHEPMGVQAFGPELAVELLDETVVGRLFRAGEVQGDRIGISPEIKVAGDEYAAIARWERSSVAGYGRPRNPPELDRKSVV